MANPKRFVQLFVNAAKAWSDDFAPSMGAAISYYTVFSIAPLLVIVIAIAGAVFGRDAVQGAIVEQLSNLIGQQAAGLVQGLIAGASASGRGLVAGAISVVVLLLGATSVFTELQSALDRIWHVPPSQEPQGLWALIRARLLSFGLILGLVFLLMVSLVVSTALAAFGSWTGDLMPGSEALLHLANFTVSTAILTLLFAMIYKLMPSTRIAWRDVWIGALVTAVLFDVGKLLIGLYLGKSNLTQSYQAAGSLVVLLAWVYYAAQVFLLGAEFTKAFATQRGSATQQAPSQPQAIAVSALHAAEAPKALHLVETPASRARLEAVDDPALHPRPLRAAEAGTHAAMVRLITQVVALAVLRTAAALVSRRRKALLNELGRSRRMRRMPSADTRSMPS